MMRRQIMPFSEQDPQPKRARLDTEEDSKETVKQAMLEQENSLIKLLEERRSEVTQLEQQLAEARKKLEAVEAQLAHVQNGSKFKTLEVVCDSSAVKIKTEPEVVISSVIEENGNAGAPVNKRPLFIPGSNATTPLQSERRGPNLKVVNEPGKIDSVSTTIRRPSASAIRSELDTLESSRQQTTTKISAVKTVQGTSLQRVSPKITQGLEQKEPVDLVAQIRDSKAPGLKNMLLPNYVAGQHKRKLRSLVVNPAAGEICATSALDGVINLWEIQGKGVGLSLLGTIDCLSPGQRRWSEDMTWDPSGDFLFACYSADGKDNQVAIINASSKKVRFLNEKPHEKGIINSIIFMPWFGEQPIFATGGSDHAVVMWSEERGAGWIPKLLHRSLHSSAVMGVAGVQHKQLVLSVGADKRIFGFDTRYGRAEFKHQLDSKAMGVLPNPADFNLFMVQTGTPGQQLRLFDIRVQRSELHAFGWRQESSESQSALINQTWSPDGLYIASGSADPKIHIFDIRFNSKEPSQSIKAHQKRVLKAAWHHSLPLLVSISSDLNIGLHRFSP